jgi:hypothetical protein
MNTRAISRGLALAAVLVLGAAPAAIAERPEGAGPPEGHGPGQSHGKSGDHAKSGDHSKAGGNAVVMYVFKGIYAGASTTNVGAASVTVDRGNAHARKASLVGTTVDFDLSSATFVVADNTGDGVVDANDVASGDRVVVKARLPRKDPGQQPFAAKQLVDQTSAPAE